MSVITPAASVLLTRGPGSREIFAILRGQQLKFFGGFWAFPGGKLTPLEAEFVNRLDARRLAACRELFEETGVLIARKSDGTFPLIDDDLNRCRELLLAEQIAFETLLKDRKLTIQSDDFQLIGEITTPEFAPLRFATTFFVAHVPPGQEPAVWPGELERGEWIDTNLLLARWQWGEILLTPPSVMTLEALAFDGVVDDAPRRLGPLFAELAQYDAQTAPRSAISPALAGGWRWLPHPIFFAPHVRMVPLKTVALPPSTHTNAFFVGNYPRYLIDPGPTDPGEQQRLIGFMRSQLVDSRNLVATAIVLTHHHPDHVGAAARCAAEFDLPVFAHARTAEKLYGQVKVDRILNDGDRLELGRCPADESRPWFLEVLHTPGHASGHLALYEPFYRLLFAGDMISTLTSMVIAPPDGNLADYLQSLRRLRALPTRLLLPSHGNVSAQPNQVFDDALAHRAKREAQLLDALAEGPAAIDELTPRLYRGTPDALMRFARAQVWAGLLKLKDEGRVVSGDAERWRLC